MYINYKLLKDVCLDHESFHVLQIIYQGTLEYIYSIPNHDQHIDTLLELEYIKNSTGSKSMKVTDAGKKALNLLTLPYHTLEIDKLTEELLDMYDSNDLPIGKQTVFKDRLGWFVFNSGMDIDRIEENVLDYINSTPKEYTASLENLFWKPANVYSSQKNLRDSLFFNFICKKFRLNSDYFLNLKSNKTNHWKFNLLRLEVPRGLDKNLYLTGSYSEEKKRLQEIQTLIKKDFRR